MYMVWLDLRAAVFGEEGGGLDALDPRAQDHRGCGQRLQTHLSWGENSLWRTYSSQSISSS